MTGQPAEGSGTQVNNGSTTQSGQIKSIAGARREQIIKLAMGSKCQAYKWKDRGNTVEGYLPGMMLVYADMLLNPDREDVKIMSAARQLPESAWDKTDVLSWYNSNFKALGLNNDTTGRDTLRNTFTILVGLGPRESNGKYCAGRDASMDFTHEDSAEAGTMQGSHGSFRVARAFLNARREFYKANPQLCYKDVFGKNLKHWSSSKKRYLNEAEYCATQAKLWGKEGTPGWTWQEQVKSCPAMGIEHGGILLRKTGGSKGEFGPNRNKATEINMDCRALLIEVEKIVDAK
jgi:hypothetical protein